MSNEVPPPPGVPQLPPANASDFQVPSARAWFYAGPIILDVLAIVCTTILVALGKLEVGDYKYLIGVLVVGNMALRIPGAKIPPGGGGAIAAILFGVAHGLKGWRV